MKKINSKGMTLIETSIALFIFILIGMAIWSFQKDVFSLNDFLSNDLSIQQEARKIFKEITTEIRSISPSNTGAYPILLAENDSFIFYSDIDNDGLRERINYFLESTSLKKGVIKPTENPILYDEANEIITEIVHNIVSSTDPIFQYYDSSYDGTTEALSIPVDTTAIRLIKINLSVDKDPTRPSSPFNLTTQISMRNLKDNL